MHMHVVTFFRPFSKSVEMKVLVVFLLANNLEVQVSFSVPSSLWSFYLCTVGDVGLSHYNFMVCSIRKVCKFQPKSLQRLCVCLADVTELYYN